MDLNKFFKKASTVEEKADAIIKYLQGVGLTLDQMLEVIQLVKRRLEGRK